MSDVNKNLGHATAYGYAKSKGYTGTEDDFATLMASYADVAEQARESAEDSEAWAVGERDGVPVPDTDAQYHNNSKYYAEQASTSAGESSDSAEASGSSALVSEGHATGSQNGEPVEEGSPYYHNNALYYSQMSSQSADDADGYKRDAETAKTNAETAETNAETAEGNAEAWAVGTKDSVPVTQSDPQYQNNAKYYAEQAQNAADASAAMTGLADQFDSTTTYAIGDYVLYDGTLYQFTASHPAGAWTGTDAVQSVLSGGVSDLKSHIEESTDNIAIVMTANHYYPLSGTSITIGSPEVSTSGMRCVAVPCNGGDVFTINATGVPTARTFGFTDANGNILYRSGSTYAFTDFVLRTPDNAKYLIINDNSGGVSFVGRSLASKVNFDEKAIGYDDICSPIEFFNGGVGLSNNIGTITDINIVGYNVPHKYAIVPCSPGDVFTLNASAEPGPGQGTGLYRIYAFLDANYLLLNKSIDPYVTDKVITAPTNAAYLVINNYIADNGVSYKGKPIYLKEKNNRNDIDNLIDTVGNVVSASFTKPTGGNAVLNFACPLTAGKTIKFVWTGEDVESGELNLFSRETESGTNVETLYTGARPNIIYEVTPTVDANYLRVVATRTGSISVYAKGTNNDNINVLLDDVAQLKEEVTKTPFVRFGFTYDMYDPSDIFGASGEIGDINGWNSKAEALSKVHNAFDALCASGGAGHGYGERITGLYKIRTTDNALVDVLAPGYVTNGVTQGETVTLPIGTDSGGNPVTYNYTYESSTLPYEVRLYRFHDTNTALHKNSVDIPKKKILLVGGTHGNEFCAPIDLYVLAKHLCTDYTNPDVLKLRSSFDIYIVPYLDGFGCQYQWSNNGTMTTGARCNGRMVDINRNCYTAGWAGETGTASQITANFEAKIANLATNTFAGSSNGSEFESQLIKGLIEQIQPDVFIDHHHNSGNAPFYTICRGDYAGNLIYQSANDSAYARIHNMSQYFGTKYNLFLGDDVSPATKSASNGHMDTMAYELGVKMNAVSEMPESIAYLNGVIDNATKAATRYSALAFKQAEYTLLNVALHLCQWAMEH